MDNYIYQEYNMQDRIKMLQNLAVKSEIKTYNRSLTDSEIEMEKDKFSSDAIEKDRQEKELKNTQERMKAGIKSVETLMEERLERIKSGQTEITGTLYGLPNHDKGVMNFYDGYGERINTRPLTPDEKQGRLFIGDDPKPEPSGPESPIEEAIYVESDNENEIQGGGDIDAEDDLSAAVDSMYAEEGKSIDIEVKAPEEDKPAPTKGTKKGSKKPANGDPI